MQESRCYATILLLLFQDFQERGSEASHSSLGSFLLGVHCNTSSEVDGTEKTRQDNTTTRHGSVKYNHLDRLGTIPQEDFQALLSLDTRPDTESNKLKQSRILLPL